MEGGAFLIMPCTFVVRVALIWPRARLVYSIVVMDAAICAASLPYSASEAG